MYKITIIQHLKYNETIEGSVETYSKAKDIMTLMLEAFPSISVTISMEETADNTAEADTQIKED